MLIRTDHLKLSLSGHAILHDVNVNLERGQIYGLLGPNGAGKSTTIAVLLGLYEADAGTVSRFGETGARSVYATRSRVGVMPERAGFYGWMNAPDYLAWYAEFYGGSRYPFQELLQKVGLVDIGRRPIGQFSHGMRQRLALARALLHAPELLILDEPTNGLDPRGRREIHDLLLTLAQEQGVGILLCTHLLDDVDRLCTRIGILDHGRTLLEGSLVDLVGSQEQAGRFSLRLNRPPPSQDLPPGVTLLKHEGHWWHLALSSEHQAAPDQCWQKLLKQGWPILEIKAEGGGLESLYIRFTHNNKASGHRETA